MAVLSAGGMLLIALSPAHTNGGNITIKMIGILIASFSSGVGELSFLSLTHFYGLRSLSAWGSGTGAAGLVGAGAYAFATTTLAISARTTLLASASLPLGMLLSFFFVLPHGPLSHHEAKVKRDTLPEQSPGANEDDEHVPIESELEGLLPSEGTDSLAGNAPEATLKENLKRARKLFIP